MYWLRVLLVCMILYISCMTIILSYLAEPGLWTEIWTKILATSGV